MDQVELNMLVDIGLKFYAVPSRPTRVTLRSMILVIDLIDLVAKHKSGELRCPATALIHCLSHDRRKPGWTQTCRYSHRRRLEA